MAVLRYFHQDPRQTSVQESSVIDKQGTVLTQKLTTINQSITNNTQVLEDKQNSVPGKSLSTNDFTDEYKNKLRGIEEGAQVNVQSDWGEDDNTADSYIKNKPVIDDIVTQNSENLITSGAVFTAIDELPEPMIFKGSLGVGGTIQTLPAPSADNVGFVYKVITAGAYYGITAKPGDSFISDGSDWILVPSGDEPEGTVMSVGLTVPTGLQVSGSPVTTSGTLAITYALGYAIPTTAKQDEWDAKQNAISDLSTIRTNANNGNTAYGWGNHANAGYQAAISDLATIRSNASEGHTAYGWGNHANAGYVKSSGVTSVAMTVPTGLSVSGSPITSTGTLALSFANGYSIPTTTKQGNWDTAYGWGNHASAGYVKSSGVTKISTTDGVVGGDITTTGTIKANLASYTKNASDIGGKLYAVQLDKSGRLAVNVPWTDHYAWSDITGKPSSYYTLPLAASGTRGGVQIGFTTDAANRNYAVQLSGEKMYVNVPWTDNNTTYPLAVKDITRSGTTFTATRYDGTTFTFTQQDNNTTYSAGSGLSLSGTTFSLALTKNLVTTALGYTPPTQDTNTTYSIATGDDNGQIKVTPSSGSAYNVKVKGLGSRAYDSTSYLPLAGGTMVAGSMINWADWGQWGKSDATYPKAQGGLKWAGTSDWIQLNAEEVASDDIRLILAFGDDTSPSLDIRDNSGTTTMRLLSSGQINATSFVKSDGTSSQFLKADGSVDSNSYITGITKTMVTNALGYTPPTTNTWIAWKGATANAAGTAGYMPAPTSAQRGQFLRGDGSWVSLNNYSLPTATNEALGGVKTGAAITDTTGYTAVAIKNGIIYYKDTNTTYSDFVKSGSTAAHGLVPKPPTTAGTTKYLREDGTWQQPPNTWRGVTDSYSGTDSSISLSQKGGNALYNKIVDDYLLKNTAGGIASVSGNGENWWFRIATIKIVNTYINRPVVFEISQRAYEFSILQIIFKSINNTDPQLLSFTTNNVDVYYIKKTATSTWEVYGKYSEVWGTATLHRITGCGANIGVPGKLSDIAQ